jgi:hypothetical protein
MTIEKISDNVVTISVNNIMFILNGNPLSEEEIERFHLIHGDNAENIIAENIFMREAHKKIIELDDIDNFAIAVTQNPNTGFLSYCTEKIEGFQLPSFNT